MNSNDVVAIGDLAKFYLDIEEYEKCKILCNHILNLEPNNIRAFEYLGIVYFNLEKFRRIYSAKNSRNFGTF